MKKLLGMLGLVFGMSVAAFAGTPQEVYFQGQAPLSGATILASSSAATSIGNLVLTISTPTAINSGGSVYNGRNCFTDITVQMSTAAVLTIQDGATVKFNLYGSGLGTTGTNTRSISRDHLGPICTSTGNQTVMTITNTGGSALNAVAINTDGYTTYGGTNNSGSMY